MALSLDDKLVIAVSSSALFDTRESHDVWQKLGPQAYRLHQRERENVPFPCGQAFAFIQRLLELNDPGDGFSPVEVVLLSRNSADTGVRAMNSVRHYRLDISRAIFRGGRPPFSFSRPLGAKLYLSTNRQDVANAIQAGLPGGLIVGPYTEPSKLENELRIAFDFDGILADDSAETIYQQSGLEGFHEHELEHSEEPLNPGPLRELLDKISRIQKLELEKKQKDGSYQVKLRTAICTARNAPADMRVITTLRKWGVDVDEMYFLGGLSKREVLAEFRPHIFFDDQQAWIEETSESFACVHVPYGKVNERLDQTFNSD